ncbi:MAG: imidazole glycerol phosphate synthase subunit HisF [Bacteroidota bacterium]
MNTLAKRIIPCLDIRDGRTVKGVNFVDIRDAGDPVELAQRYSAEGADELVFLDITASHEKRKLLKALVEKVAARIKIPFTVGGGVSELQDADVLLSAGADKISVNSAAIMQPALIDELARQFGSQFVVVAIDARLESQRWQVYRNGGRIPTGRELFEYAREMQERGAGEILWTSMNHDGTQGGFANDTLRLLSQKLSIPLIASGGAGTKQHFADAFTLGEADAALAASVFHYDTIPIPELKEYLKLEGINVRLK